MKGVRIVQLILVVLVGVFQIAFGFLGFARLTRFVSYSVTTGFLSGVAVLLGILLRPPQHLVRVALRLVVTQHRLPARRHCPDVLCPDPDLPPPELMRSDPLCPGHSER